MSWRDAALAFVAGYMVGWWRHEIVRRLVEEVDKIRRRKAQRIMEERN